MPRTQQAVRASLEEADVVFAVGADMFTMSLYSDIEPLPPDVVVVCLDADPWEMGKNYAVDVAILGDPKATLTEMVPMIGNLMSEASRQTAAQRAETLRCAKAEARQRLRAQAAEETANTKTPMSALAMNHGIM